MLATHRRIVSSRSPDEYVGFPYLEISPASSALKSRLESLAAGLITTLTSFWVTRSNPRETVNL